MNVGRPVPILVVKEDHTFKLDLCALESIFLQGKVKDKHVVVVSVAGAFRMGKSFLLDFMLRYLKNKGYEGSQDWLGHQDEPLTGFNWKHSCERVTNGILIWSEPFIVTSPKGEKLAVFLMDTQGVFDSGSTEKECATIFALSTLISSVQVFNLTGNIKEDDLQHLQYFTEYGKLCFDQTKERPFQTLMFLVRDWSNFHEYEYGIQGGQRFLDKRLKISPGQHKELQDLRKHLTSCFGNISCFLMPHPGLNVTEDPAFDGRLSKIGDKFKSQLQDLMHILLDPSNLIAKTVNGQKISCKQLVQYFAAYFHTFNSGKLPEPKSVFQATAEVNAIFAVSNTRDFYLKKMEMTFTDETPAMSQEIFDATHGRIVLDSLDHFNSIKKMGSDEFFKPHIEKLKREFSKLKAPYMERNNVKLAIEKAKEYAIIGLGAVAAGAFGILRFFR